MQARLMLRRPSAEAEASVAPVAPEAAPGPRLVLSSMPKSAEVPVRGYLRRVDGGVIAVRPHGREATGKRLPPTARPPVSEVEPPGVQLKLAPRPDGGEPPRANPVQLALSMTATPAPRLHVVAPDPLSYGGPPRG